MKYVLIAFIVSLSACVSTDYEMQVERDFHMHEQDFHMHEQDRLDHQAYLEAICTTQDDDEIYYEGITCGF